MPRLFGLNLIAVLAGALVIYAIGAVIFGVLASDFWMRETLVDHGLVQRADVASLPADRLMKIEIPGALSPAVALSIGFLISLVTAIGLAALLSLVKPQSLAAALGVGLVAWFGFAVTTLAYDPIYASNSIGVFLLQSGHLLLDLLAASAVIFALDRKALTRRTPQ